MTVIASDVQGCRWFLRKMLSGKSREQLFLVQWWFGAELVSAGVLLRSEEFRDDDFMLQFPPGLQVLMRPGLSCGEDAGWLFWTYFALGESRPGLGTEVGCRCYKLLFFQIVNEWTRTSLAEGMPIRPGTSRAHTKGRNRPKQVDKRHRCGMKGNQQKKREGDP